MKRKGAGGIILKGKKVLLIKRGMGSEKFPGYWGMPAGRAEENETPEQTVKREVKEETNIDFKPTELIKIMEYKDRELYRFLGTWKGEIKLQKEEIDEYGWFTYDQAKKLKLAFDYEEVIDILHKRGLM